MSDCSFAQRRRCQASRRWDEAQTKTRQEQLVAEVLTALENLDHDPEVPGVLKTLAISSVWSDDRLGHLELTENGVIIRYRRTVMTKRWFGTTSKDEVVRIHYTEDLERTRKIIIETKVTDVEVADVTALIQPWKMQQALAT